MPENITFEVVGIDQGREETIVELEGMAASLIPDFVVESRARLKAIRVVGGEQIARGALEDIIEGNLGRVTEIVDIDMDEGQLGGREVSIAVAVEVDTTE